MKIQTDQMTPSMVAERSARCRGVSGRHGGRDDGVVRLVVQAFRGHFLCTMFDFQSTDFGSNFKITMGPLH